MRGYDGFNFFVPAQALRNFLWNVFAPHYLEMVKSRAYGNECSDAERDAALYTLHYCLKGMLVLLSPITPFITDYIHRELYGTTVHKEQFPKPSKSAPVPFTTEDLQDLNSTIWKIKKDKGLSLKTSLKEAILPSVFKGIEKDLRATHGIEKLSYGSSLTAVVS